MTVLTIVILLILVIGCFVLALYDETQRPL